MGASFGGKTQNFVFSRQPPPPSVPSGVEFVTEPVAALPIGCVREAARISG